MGRQRPFRVHPLVTGRFPGNPWNLTLVGNEVSYERRSTGPSGPIAATSYPTHTALIRRVLRHIISAAQVDNRISGFRVGTNAVPS